MVECIELTCISQGSLWLVSQESVGGGQGGIKEHSVDAVAVTQGTDVA